MNTELVQTQNNMRPANPFGEIAQGHQGHSTTAITEQSRAMVEALAPYQMARQSPRNQQMAFQRIMDACGRPTLAEKAIYAYPRGGQEINGPSIRLAEAVAQQWGNMAFGIKELSRISGASEVMAFAVDMETNVHSTTIFQVPHVRGTRNGPVLLTDERDIYEMVANMGSRRKRACILAVLPGDIVAAATEACEQTLKAQIDVTPDLIRRIREKFAAVGVTDAMLVKRLGRPLDKLEAGNVFRLKTILNSITDGMATVEQHFDITAEPAKQTAADKVKTKAESVTRSAKKETAEEDPQTKDFGEDVQDEQKPNVQVCEHPGCGEVLSAFQAERSITKFGTFLCKAHESQS